MTADNGTTSQRTAPRRRYTRLYDSGSSQNEILVVRSQFDDLSVCTHGDCKNDFLHCNDDDDSRTERAFLRQTAAARVRDHSPGRSHSLPPPRQRTQGLGPVATTGRFLERQLNLQLANRLLTLTGG